MSSDAGAGAAQPMLRRLRVKFVALSMTVVTLALVAALAAIGYLDYRQSVDDVYDELRQTLGLAASVDAGHRGDGRLFGEPTPWAGRRRGTRGRRPLRRPAPAPRSPRLRIRPAVTRRHPRRSGAATARA